MNAAHFVTGGTGFVGSNLILELLQQSRADVWALVRRGGESASVRLQKALLHAARTAGYGASLDGAIEKQCHAVEGNIEEEACGVEPARLPRLTQFWHVAASLRFEDRYADQIYRANVEGTRNALALGQRCRVERHFNYVSTAYVAGRHTGVIAEESASAHETNNHYERSKVQAELLVQQAKGLLTRIYRPSIVIGHSRTHAVASGFSGLYGFIRRVLRLAQIMRRLQDGLIERTNFQVYADPGALMNLIPADVVARQMVRISQSAAKAKIFHITNPTPPAAGDVASVIFRELDLRLPLFVRDTAQFTWLDRKLDEGLDFYRSYFRGTKLFDRRNSDAALGKGEEPGYRLDAATLTSYVRWYAGVLRGSNAAVMVAA